MFNNSFKKKEKEHCYFYSGSDEPFCWYWWKLSSYWHFVLPDSYYRYLIMYPLPSCVSFLISFNISGCDNNMSGLSWCHHIFKLRKQKAQGPKCLCQAGVNILQIIGKFWNIMKDFWFSTFSFLELLFDLW